LGNHQKQTRARNTISKRTDLRRLGESLSTAISLLAGAADLVIVTLLVAWALEETIYFSLFVGIPVGVVSAVLTFFLLRRFLRELSA
jgi:hypothetical protein